MEIKTDILAPFFREPRRGYLIREMAKITGINHTTMRKYLAYYAKEGIIVKKPANPYDVYSANTSSKKYLNLKQYYNLELIRESGLVEKLERAYNYPPIVLFGSFAKALDDEKSDIDLCLISDIRKEIDLSDCERITGRKIAIHQFTQKAWAAAKAKNPDLINSIINGITLSGQIEVA